MVNGNIGIFFIELVILALNFNPGEQQQNLQLYNTIHNNKMT